MGWLLGLASFPDSAVARHQDGSGSVSLAWIGNTGVSQGRASPVQPAITDVWVDRDGTAFAVAPGELGFPSAAAYREGLRQAVFPGVEGLVVTGNRTDLFIGTHGGVQIVAKTASSHRPERDNGWLRIEAPAMSHGAGDRSTRDGYSIRGLHATDRRLWISNASRNQIEEWDLQTRRPIRVWPFERPGALVPDPWEGLWVVRERRLASDRRPERSGGSYAGDEEEVLEPALLVRFDQSSGRVLETLSEVGIPVALAIQIRAEDDYPALIVADNGPRQQLLRYSRRNPRRSRRVEPWGNPWGRLGPAGPRGHDGRFNGFAGMGFAADGSLTVALNWNLLRERSGEDPAPCVEILTFSPSGELRHAAQALYHGSPATLQPDPPYDVFFRHVRLAVDWKHPELQWSLRGRTSHPLWFRDHNAGNLRTDPFLRTVKDQRLLLENEQGTLRLSRADPARLGQVWIPMGAIRPQESPGFSWPSHVSLPDLLEASVREEAAPSFLGLRPGGEAYRSLQDAMQGRVALARTFGWVWMDGRGAEPLDGRLQADEVQSLGGRLDDGVWSVDASGGLWLSARETSPYAATTPVRFTSWLPERTDPNGLPVFRRQPPKPVPAPFSSGTVLWHRYLPASNQMLVAGTTPLQTGAGPRLLNRYEAWVPPEGSKPQARWTGSVVLGEEGASGPGDPAILAMDCSDDWLFTLRADPLRMTVYDLIRGNRVATFRTGNAPAIRQEDGGAPTLRAVDRNDGGVSLLVSAPGWDRLLALDWRPGPVRRMAPSSAPALRGVAYSRRVDLLWSTEETGRIQGYHLYRAVGDGPLERLSQDVLAGAYYQDSGLVNGETYTYRVRLVAEEEVGPLSEPVRLVPSATVVRFVGEDRRTLGNWRGTYGAEGYLLFGEVPDPEQARNPVSPAGASGPNPSLAGDPRTFVPDLRLDPALPLRSAPGAETQRVAGFLEVLEDQPVVFPVAIRNGSSLRTSLYCGSSERIHGVRIEFLDPVSEAVLAVREFSNEGEPGVRGRYLTWDVTGTVWIRLSVPRGGPLPDQCGINAVFFDPVTFREDPGEP